MVDTCQDLISSNFLVFEGFSSLGVGAVIAMSRYFRQTVKHNFLSKMTGQNFADGASAMPLLITGIITFYAAITKDQSSAIAGAIHTLLTKYALCKGDGLTLLNPELQIFVALSCISAVFVILDEGRRGPAVTSG